MIHHLSIAARDPKRVAEVLAECMEGIAVPFPPNPGSFFAVALDSHGTGVEVYPAGTVMEPAGEEGGKWEVRDQATPGFTATHFALSVTSSEKQIAKIAAREGWQAHVCSRSGNFHVIELWLENTTMVELLPPEFAREYLVFAQPANLDAFIKPAA